MFKKKKPKQPDYVDLMAIVKKLERVDDIALFTKYFVLHLCHDFLKLPEDTLIYLTDIALESADKSKKGLLGDNKGIWN